MPEPLHPALLRKAKDLAARCAAIESQTVDPAVVRDQGRSRLLFKELGRLRKIRDMLDLSESLWQQVAEAHELSSGGDAELAELARAELPGLEHRYGESARQLETMLLSDDQNAERNAILEIRAGTGGEEAALFCRDLVRLYKRFCDRQGWRMTALSLSESDLGGFREAIFAVEGDGVFRYLRFEMGGHRVQRVPVTESQGRIQTSAATVAVLPEAEEVEIVLDTKDYILQTTTASGPGGQHVNKTESAVRITHLATGITVFCQEERSQHKNKARAFSILRARLFDLEQQRRQQERAEVRRTQVGSGDRSQRIRTYNWADHRVTDHRTQNNYNLEKVLDGDLMPILDDLLALEREERLKAI